MSQQYKTVFKLRKAGIFVPVAALMGLGAIGTAAIMQDVDYDASAATETVNTNLTPTNYYISLCVDDGCDGEDNVTVDMDLEATADGGYAYATSNVVAKTNVPSGYELYITAGANGNTLIHSNGSGSGVIAAASGTGGASGTPAVLASNSYGYAVPSGVIGNNGFDSSYADDDLTANSKWAKVPTSATGDKIRTGSMTGASTAPGETTDVHFAVYANNAMAAGTYTGTVVYSMVADMPSVGLSITPNTAEASTTQSVKVVSGPIVASGASIGTGDVTVKIGGSTCTVTATSTSKGYLETTCTAPGLAGTEDGTSYDVEIKVSKYSYEATLTGGYTVTAPAISTLDDITTMQEVYTYKNIDLCGNSTKYSAAGNKQYTLKDSRTGQSYTIRKLEDEKCWMVQNLYLTGGTQITSSNSDITATSYTLPSSTTTGFSTSSTSNMNNGDTTKGSYYSWPVATAGTGSAYGSSTNNSPTSSICPKGWKLPTGGSGGEFETLYNKYGSYSSFTGPWNFTAVGRYSTGSLGNTTYTLYWSRTGDSDNYAYSLRINSSISSVNATSNNFKYYGYSVRCVLSTS